VPLFDTIAMNGAVNVACDRYHYARDATIDVDHRLHPATPRTSPESVDPPSMVRMRPADVR